MSEKPIIINLHKLVDKVIIINVGTEVNTEAITAAVNSALLNVMETAIKIAPCDDCEHVENLESVHNTLKEAKEPDGSGPAYGLTNPDLH